MDLRKKKKRSKVYLLSSENYSEAETRTTSAQRKSRNLQEKNGQTSLVIASEPGVQIRIHNWVPDCGVYGPCRSGWNYIGLEPKCFRFSQSSPLANIILFFFFFPLLFYIIWNNENYIIYTNSSLKDFICYTLVESRLRWKTHPLIIKCGTKSPLLKDSPTNNQVPGADRIRIS